MIPREPDTLVDQLKEKGVSRRNFLKFCGAMAAALAMPKAVSAQIAEALQTKKRPPLIWLEMQDCAGCSESLLRASRPGIAEIVLDVLSVDYHETIMAAAGNLAEEAKQATMKAGGYLLVVEGSLPTNDDGVYCCVGGKSSIDLLKEAAAGAVAVIAVGNCAAFGGVAKAGINPTGAVGVMDIVKDKPVLNLPGCPFNAVNLTATVVHYLTFNALPAMDKLGRPMFAYGQLIHNNCERRGHFDAGEFVRAWGDAGHRAGWCLYQMGCKGPVTYHNCPTVRWNDGTSWPVGSGHGCIGCSQPGFWDLGLYTKANVTEVTPPALYPSTTPAQKPLDATNVGLATATLGVIAGAVVAVAARQLTSKKNGDAETETPAAVEKETPAPSEHKQE